MSPTSQYKKMQAAHIHLIFFFKLSLGRMCRICSSGKSLSALCRTSSKSHKFYQPTNQIPSQEKVTLQFIKCLSNHILVRKNGWATFLSLSWGTDITQTKKEKVGINQAELISSTSSVWWWFSFFCLITNLICEKR